jgi:hypothetical protein
MPSQRVYNGVLLKAASRALQEKLQESCRISGILVGRSRLQQVTTVKQHGGLEWGAAMAQNSGRNWEVRNWLAGGSVASAHPNGGGLVGCHAWLCRTAPDLFRTYNTE